MKLGFPLFGLVLTVPAAMASALPECLVQVAMDYRVPPFILESIALQEANQPPSASGSRTYGPMGMKAEAIGIAAKSIKANPKAIAVDPCFNVEAAAWWLMNEASTKTDPDIWRAVERYYYGNRKRDTYPLVDGAKAIYEEISVPPSAEVMALSGFQDPQFTVARCNAALRRLASDTAAKEEGSIAGVMDSEFHSNETAVLVCSATFAITYRYQPDRTSAFSAQVNE